MLDIKYIRQNPQATQKRLQTKDPSIDLAPLLALDEQMLQLKTEVEELKSKRNAASKEIGNLKRAGKEIFTQTEEMGQLATSIATKDEMLASVEKQWQAILCNLPNLPMEDVKVSLNPKENVCIKEYKGKPVFDFPFKNHVELNEKLNLFDFKRGAKTSGSGWVAYRNLGARLEWALLQYMMQVQIKNGFMQWIPPFLVKEETMYGSGQLPKFEQQLFKLTDKDYSLYLIPTSEVVLNGLHADEIIEAEQLPLKYVAYSPCFRREAGAAGSQERGLIRIHQFNKVEMFCFTLPEQSESIFNQMLQSAEEILQGLNLHYRNMLLVTGDMSWAAARTVDIEVWLPGQNRYYEVSSVSNCLDFQARRSLIRYRRKGDKAEYLHTLNGSGLATSRLMVALLENNQQADGSIVIPEVLRPFLGGLTVLDSHS